MTLSFEEIEGLLHNLQPETTPFVGERVYAATKLGNVETSTLPIVQALLTALESDPDTVVRKRAGRSLLAAVHQDIMQDFPDLQARSLEAQQALGADVLEPYSEDKAEGTFAVPRYPVRSSVPAPRKISGPHYRGDFIYDIAYYAVERVARSVIAYVVGLLFFVVLVCCGSYFSQ